MAEIYKDQTSPIKTKIFWAGEIVDADDDLVTATIYDITQDITISPTVNPANVLLTLSATKLETDIGTYQVVIPFQYCQRNRKFKIVWSYEVGGVEASHTYYADVVTPYANMTDILQELNIGTDPSDPNHKTYHELQMAEKYARKLIEEYCNQSFYLYDDAEIAYGSGSDVLALPYRIHQIHKLYENDVLVIDNINSENNWIFEPVISESNFGIRVNRQDLLDNVTYTANGLIPPSINDRGYSGAFRENFRYVVSGRFGWPTVPDNVEEACLILIQQYFDKDTAWRNKYVKSISTFDWKFDYTSDAHSGTGNLYADQLLSTYVISGMATF
jgi:hypothetical protein